MMVQIYKHLNHHLNSSFALVFVLAIISLDILLYIICSCIVCEKENGI